MQREGGHRRDAKVVQGVATDYIRRWEKNRLSQFAATDRWLAMKLLPEANNVN